MPAPVMTSRITPNTCFGSGHRSPSTWRRWPNPEPPTGARHAARIGAWPQRQRPASASIGDAARLEAAAFAPGPASALVALPGELAMTLDILRFLLVDMGEAVAGACLCMQELV